MRRLAVSLAHLDLNESANYLRALGSDGMSIDESSDEGDEGSSGPLVALEPPWRSSKVSEWLLTIDDIHAYDILKSSRTEAVPPVRQRSVISSNSKPVPRLPRNFYNRKWLMSLNPLRLAALQAQPSVSLEHSEKIKRLDRCFSLPIRKFDSDRANLQEGRCSEETHDMR
jgi:hypothetical protein